MKDKRVLITGAASGIGFCLAEEFLRAGATVIITDKDRDRLSEARKELETMFLKTVYNYRCDVEFVKDIQMVRAHIEDEWGGIDVLINNAGMACNKEMADMDHYEWRRLVNVNLLGPIYHINEFLPGMIEQGSGHIVNVSSGQAFFRLPTWGAYATTKVALGAMSELLSFELAKHGVKVSTVYPFMVDTPFYKGVEGDTFAARMSMKLIPYYSNTPQSVAKKILRAVEKNKRVEMINPINRIGFVMRSLPPVADSVSWLTNKLLARS